MASERPNVLLFMMDTQSARNMSCYGYHRETTPNIDRLAAEGVLFQNHFVTAPWTLPVHSSLFTGRYESGHGAGAQHEGLEPGLPSLPEVMTRNGYRTAGFCNNGWAMADDEWNPARGFEEQIRYGGLDAVPPFVPSDDPAEKDKGSLKLVGIVKDWLDRNATGDRPFFLFVHNGEPHNAYTPPEPFRSRFLAEGVTYEEAVAIRGHQVDSTVGIRNLSFREWEIERSLYDGATACLDHRIGLLLEVLQEKGLLDDTLFIVTGDHGDTQGEHVGHAYHSQNGIWDTVIKTPLVARLPGAFHGGVVCRELVQIVDIFPALLQLLELNEPEAAASIQGASLLEALKGPVREFALAECQTPKHVFKRAWSMHPDQDVRWLNEALKAARTLKYKYIWSSVGRDMLFDIENDPDEQCNIIGRKPEVARELQQELEELLMSMEQRYYQDMYRPGRPKIDAKAIRRLAAWGLYQPGIVPPWTDD